jgi:hypothetical protein
VTNADYNRFLEDFRARFPDDATWLDQHPQTAMLWYTEVFRLYSLAECLEVGRDIFGGSLPKWDRFDRASIAAHFGRQIRQRAYDTRMDDEDREKRIRKSEQAAQSGDRTTLGAFVRLRKLMAAGVSKARRLNFTEDWFDGRDVSQYFDEPEAKPHFEPWGLQ